MSVYLQETEADTAVAERRRSSRVGVKLAVTLSSPTAMPFEPAVQADGINRSESGMLLIADEPVPAGTFHILRIPGEPTCEVRIMHCRLNQDDGRYDIGIAFC